MSKKTKIYDLSNTFKKIFTFSIVYLKKVQEEYEKCSAHYFKVS